MPVIKLITKYIGITQFIYLIKYKLLEGIIDMYSSDSDNALKYKVKRGKLTKFTRLSL